jgi:hypothetical protein
MAITARVALLCAVCLALTGCMNRATATFAPERDMSDSDVIYVERFDPDRRHLNRIIADQLALMGYAASAGEPENRPDETTVLVTYVDKWQWDMSNYLIELTVTFRDPDTGIAFASGNSMHTSLTRKSPEEMIEEVLTNILAADSGDTE